jgi:site-specific DNA-cytosine methylase
MNYVGSLPWGKNVISGEPKIIRPLNVLSLFDGISCGQIALNKANIPYNNYFASEIDKNAIKVTQYNYPDTIQLGGVTRVKGFDLPNIDLLIGGSPCQGFSFAGKLLNFDDPRSKLFFEYVRLLKETKPKYFLLENVVTKKSFINIISCELGVYPIKINSSLVSAQNRTRLYWTNIKGITHISDMGITFRDIMDLDLTNYEYIPNEITLNRKYTRNYLQYDINRKGHRSQSQRAYYLDNKHGCLCTKAYSNAKVLDDKGRIRKITRNEAERLQCVPDGYTNSVSRNRALSLLGNGWTVDVVAHILSNITK